MGNIQTFILGASKIAGSYQENPLLHGVGNFSSAALDWTINSLLQSGIDKSSIYFVGGYDLEKIMSSQTDIHYIVNPKWHSTHVVGSLACALENWKGGDILLMYADTLFRNEVIKEVFNTKYDIALGADFNWLERVKDLEKSRLFEKVYLDNKRVKRIEKGAMSASESTAQFSGLTFIKQHIVGKIKSLLDNVHQTKTAYNLNEQSSFSTFLNIIKDEFQVELGLVNHTGKWAELDMPSDLARFALGTKAETLDRIRPMVTKSEIPDQVHFSVAAWNSDKNAVLKEIQNKFSNEQIIVRSSSLNEDAWQQSNAGTFLSIANIDGNSSKDISVAIDKVIKSYAADAVNSNFENNQVLIQPFIQNVTSSGVVFTRHLERGTPYYTINYDESTSATDTVTSGLGANLTTVTVYKNAKIKNVSQIVTQVIDAAEELESKLVHNALDIEFVRDSNSILHIVQVRPIAVDSYGCNHDDFEGLRATAKRVIESRRSQETGLFGKKTILADMPDWNPAEMIGTRPLPLAISLYKMLITDSTWRIARGRIGYCEPFQKQLMVLIGGHPYIDTRISFNSLLPKGLRDATSEKLINYYVEKLDANRHLFDKIEFEIAITCLTPTTKIKLKALRNSGFEESELDELKGALTVLTQNILTGNTAKIDDLLSETQFIDETLAQLNINECLPERIPETIGTLINNTIDKGTLPFSILARYGFIAKSFLNDLEYVNAISKVEKNEFLAATTTIAGELVNDMAKVHSKTMPRDSFLKKYGHLRPGTYDINSFSYREQPNYYFAQNSFSRETKHSNIQDRPFEWSAKTLVAIQRELDMLGLSISSNELMAFIAAALKAREYAKFQFTKNIDAILTLMIALGKNMGLSRSDMGYLWLEDVLRMRDIVSLSTPKYLAKKVHEGKEWYAFASLLETPGIIASGDDIDFIVHGDAEPNFVTDKRVFGQIIEINQNQLINSNLDDKIVIIEGADPGYDWILLHNIKGLITKFGGAGSHMTIRCAEFGLPAAIGCGENLFNSLKKATTVELNCQNRKIEILA